MSTVTEKATETKLPTLSEKVIAISKLAVDATKMDSQTGIPSEIGETTEAIVALYPEIPSVQVVEVVDEMRHDMAAGFRHAAGVVALDAMKSNTELKTAEISYGMGGTQSIDFVVHKSKEYNNPSDPENKTVKYGVVEATHNDTSVSNKGQFKKAQQLINAMAAEAFAK